MNNLPIIVIGAGAAGLIAARQILHSGRKVILLEARERTGGRIHTIQSNGYVIEAAAEFIHGDLPITIALLHEYKIRFAKTGGVMARAEYDQTEKTDWFVEGWDKLLNTMKELQTDLPLEEFLDKNFAGEKFLALRNTARLFAEGFDLADPKTASTKALYREWASEDDDEQFRVHGGYSKLTDAIFDDCIKMGCEVNFSVIVKNINWQKDQVQLMDQNGNKFIGSKVVITVPLGVLNSGKISFSPTLPEIKSLHDIGFGTVVKIILECKKAFWEEKIKDLGFVFSDEPVPTWWTQLPDQDPLLTGWAGGDSADKLHSKTDEEIFEICVQALANIFQEKTSVINSLITKIHIFNWTKDPFTLGAYSFPMVQTDSARKLFDEPIQNTIYFAGEAFYSGPVGGTVEAALKSGIDAAKKIIEE